MSELQRQTDVEKAAERLEQAQQTKEALKDPRAREDIPVRPRPPEGAPKREIRKVEKKPKKKKFGQRLKEAMFAEDIGDGSVTEYVFFKIFIPSVKQVLSNMANSAINMALGLDPKTRTVMPSHTASASALRDRNLHRPGVQGSRYRDAVSDIEWDHETACDIYNQIVELVDKYGDCSLADVYSMMDMGNKIRTTDRNWGWNRGNIRWANVVPVSEAEDRWVVDLPEAVALYR